MKTVQDFVKENRISNKTIEVWESNMQAPISFGQSLEIISGIRWCTMLIPCLLSVICINVFCIIFFYQPLLVYCLFMIIMLLIDYVKILRLYKRIYHVPRFIAECRQLMKLLDYRTFPNFDILRNDINRFKSVNPNWVENDEIRLLLFRFTEHNWES